MQPFFVYTQSFLPILLSAPSIFGKRPGIESFFYKGFFLPSGNKHLSSEAWNNMCIAVKRDRASAFLDADAMSWSML